MNKENSLEKFTICKADSHVSAEGSGFVTISDAELENLLGNGETLAQEVRKLQDDLLRTRAAQETLKTENLKLTATINESIPPKLQSLNSAQEKLNFLLEVHAGDVSIERLRARILELESNLQQQIERSQRDTDDSEHLLLLLSERLNQWTSARDKEQEALLVARRELHTAQTDLADARAKICTLESVLADASLGGLPKIVRQVEWDGSNPNSTENTSILNCKEDDDRSRFELFERHKSPLFKSTDAERDGFEVRLSYLELKDKAEKFERELGFAREQLREIPALQEELLTKTKLAERVPALLEQVRSLANDNESFVVQQEAALSESLVAKDSEISVLRAQLKAQKEELERLEKAMTEAQNLLERERQGREQIVNELLTPLGKRIAAHDGNDARSADYSLPGYILKRLDKLLGSFTPEMRFSDRLHLLEQLVSATGEKIEAKFQMVLRKQVALEGKCLRAVDAVASLQERIRHLELSVSSKDHDLSSVSQELQKLRTQGSKDSAAISGLKQEASSLRDSVKELNDVKRKLEFDFSLAKVELEEHQNASKKALADLETVKQHVLEVESAKALVMRRRSALERSLREEIYALQQSSKNAQSQGKDGSLIAASTTAVDSKWHPAQLVNELENPQDIGAESSSISERDQTLSNLKSSDNFFEPERKRAFDLVSDTFEDNGPVNTPPAKLPKLSVSALTSSAVSLTAGSEVRPELSKDGDLQSPRNLTDLSNLFDGVISSLSVGSTSRATGERKPVIAFSGFKNAESDERFKWSGRVQLSQQCAKLGAAVLQLVENRYEESCTHIVIVPGTRTKKSLCAIAAGCWVISDINWIKHSVEAGRFVDERAYGRRHAQPMFEGKTLYIHPSISVSGSTLLDHVKNIFVDCGKGRLVSTLNKAGEQEIVDYILARKDTSFTPDLCERAKVLDVRGFFDMVNF